MGGMANFRKHKVALNAQAICSIVLLAVAFQVIQKWQYQNEVVVQREHPKYVVHVAPFDWLRRVSSRSPST